MIGKNAFCFPHLALLWSMTSLEHVSYASMPCPFARTARDQSAADVQPLDQALVARLVLPLDVIKQLAALRHELQQPAPGMVVFGVGLEVTGQVVDALRQDRDLNLRRTGVASLRCIFLDDFSLAAGFNRHRQ